MRYERHLSRLISLRELKTGNHSVLQNMQLLKRPQLSVQKVTPAEWEYILSLEERPETDQDPVVTEPGSSSELASTNAEKGSGAIKGEDEDEEIKLQIAEAHGGST